MNPFLLDKKSRLQTWKLLRQKIHEEPSSDKQIDLVLDYWKQASFQTYLLNWDDSKNWPGPWDLLYNNNYCPSSHSLGIAYTLILSDDRYKDLTLKLINDQDYAVQKIVVCWKDWFLNHGHVDKKPRSALQNFYTQGAWAWDGKQWQSI